MVGLDLNGDPPATSINKKFVTEFVGFRRVCVSGLKSELDFGPVCLF